MKKWSLVLGLAVMGVGLCSCAMIEGEPYVTDWEVLAEHEEAPVVLGAAADDLYEMKDFARAIESGHKLVDRYPGADRALRRSAWAVIAHSSIDIAAYQDAEVGYHSDPPATLLCLHGDPPLSTSAFGRAPSM